MNDPALEHTAERERLMQAALPHVVFDGWTKTALSHGALDIGLDATDAGCLFPGGPDELVRVFAHWADQRMVERMAESDIKTLPTRDRIRLAVRFRIEAVAPYREAVRRGLAHFAFLANAASGLEALYRTVDAMWYAAGDRSANFGFYTKRGLLAGVFSATLVYWLADESDDNEGTWSFLERRIDDVMRIQRVRSRFERVVGGFPDPFQLLSAFASRW